MSAMSELVEKICALNIDPEQEDENEGEENCNDRAVVDEDEDNAGDANDNDDGGDYYVSNNIFEACEFVKKEYPELEECFVQVVDLLSACWNDREKDLLNEDSTDRLLQWMQTFTSVSGPENEPTASVLNTFFALVGGVKLAHMIYQKAKATLGEEVVTETSLCKHEDDDLTTMRARSILKVLRSIWVNGTDLSGIFAQDLAITGYLTEVVKEVEVMYEGTYMTVERFDCLSTSAILLHNFAQHSDTQDLLAKAQPGDYGAVDICANIVSTTYDPDLRLIALLTLSYIIDKNSEKQMGLLKADRDLDFLLQMIQEAFTSAGHRRYGKFGFRLDELLSGLRNLAENDDSSKFLMKKGVLAELAPILKDGNDAEKVQACNILCVLALTDGNLDEIHENTYIRELLGNLAEDKIDSVQYAAQEALFYTQLVEESNDDTTAEQENLASVEEAETPKEDTPGEHVMLSYSWSNQEKVFWIRDKLKERNYRVWIDVDDLKGHLKEAMADAVENAWVVLVCFSKSYAESKNCKKECDYADQEEKRIIPLKMEDFKPRGWLGFAITGRKYFDFSDNSDNNKVFDELIKELENKGKK